MLITQAELVLIRAIIESAGQSVDLADISIRDSVLWLRIPGGPANGVAALKALNKAGINQAIDNDFTTDENKVVYKPGASHCTVWIALADMGGVFRD